MNKFRKAYALVSSLAVLAFASTASATAYTYEFGGAPISGNGITPSSNFATLAFDSVSDIFSLTLGNLASVGFTNGTPNVLSLAVSYPTELSNGDISNVSGGVSSITTNPGNNPLGNFNFSFDFGSNSDQLITGETVTWKVSNFNVNNLSDNGSGEFAIWIDNAKLTGEGKAWYGVTNTTINPVPEPETYAMLLAGLGMMGFIVRRRKNKQT
jgi:hypothetical protein